MKKRTIEFSLIEIDVQYYMKQGYIKLYSCAECKALVVEPQKPEHAAWHIQMQGK